MHPVTQVHILNFPVFGWRLSLRHTYLPVLCSVGGFPRFRAETFIEASHARCPTVTRASDFPAFGRGFSLRHQRGNLNRLDSLISPPLGGDFH